MIRFTSKHFQVLAAIFGFTICLTAFQIRAADEVANPQYASWANFKPGSSATLACDTKVGPNQIDTHVEMIRTLGEVTPDNVVVEWSMKTQVAGHDMTSPPTKRTIKATAPARDIKETGTADVTAAGKTYKCTVIEVTGDAAAANSTRPGAAAGKATLYVNHDVPGGLVKMEAAGRDGKTMTFILTASETK